MPEAVATAIATATLTETSVLTFGQILVATQVAFVATTLAVGSHQRRKARAKAAAAYNASLEDRLVMVSTASGARSRCYGRVRNVDGVLFKATRGEKNEFFTLFVALAGHEIDAVETVYFGDKAVTLDGDGWVQTEPWNVGSKVSHSQSITLNGAGAGSITAAGSIVGGSAGAAENFTESGGGAPLAVSVAGQVISVSGGAPGATATVTWQEAVTTSKARVRAYLGGAGQDVSSVLQPLFPSLITAGEHRFAGIAGLLVDLEYDTDAFPQGVPSITAVIRGARVFDPRSNSTAWTQNPALIARDWALYAHGGAVAAGDLNGPSFSEAANACDTVQAFVTAAGTQSLPTYTCGIVCKTDEDPWQQFSEIVESMAGRAGWAGGQLRVVAGIYRAPVATITEDWITDKEPVQVVPEPPLDEAVNVYRPTIADAERDFVSVPAPEVRSTTYIAADGRELPREVTLGAVTDVVHAQHVCGVMMRDARNSLSVVLPCNLRAYQLELFDVVAVTLPRFGWAAKTFEVVDWRYSLSGGVLLSLKETAAAIYTPDASFSLLDITPNTALPVPWSVPLVTGLTVATAVAMLDDRQPIVRAFLQWDAHSDGGVVQGGWIEIQYLQLGLTDQPIGWINQTPVAVTWQNSLGQAVNWNSEQVTDPSGNGWQSVRVRGAQVDAVIAGLTASAIYLMRVRAETPLGVRSEWSIQRVVITPGVNLPGTVETFSAFDAAGIGFSSIA